MRKKWLKAAGIRALKTFAQAAIATGAFDFANHVFWGIDWLNVVGVGLTAAVLSILTSIAGLPELENDLQIEDSDVK